MYFYSYTHPSFTSHTLNSIWKSFSTGVRGSMGRVEVKGDNTLLGVLLLLGKGQRLPQLDALLIPGQGLHLSVLLFHPVLNIHQEVLLTTKMPMVLTQEPRSAANTCMAFQIHLHLIKIEIQELPLHGALLLPGQERAQILTQKTRSLEDCSRMVII